jgi:hypothetical protein
MTIIVKQKCYTLTVIAKQVNWFVLTNIVKQKIMVVLTNIVEQKNNGCIDKYCRTEK